MPWFFPWSRPKIKSIAFSRIFWIIFQIFINSNAYFWIVTPNFRDWPNIKISFLSSTIGIPKFSTYNSCINYCKPPVKTHRSDKTHIKHCSRLRQAWRHLGWGCCLTAWAGPRIWVICLAGKHKPLQSFTQDFADGGRWYWEQCGVLFNIGEIKILACFQTRNF